MSMSLGYERLTDSFFLPARARAEIRLTVMNTRLRLRLLSASTMRTIILNISITQVFFEYGGSPDKAVKSAFVSEVDRQIKLRDKYKANESKIVFQDVADSLILVTNTFSTQTSYENQTKKAINNKFIQEYMTSLIRDNLEVWFTEFTSGR